MRFPLSAVLLATVAAVAPAAGQTVSSGDLSGRIVDAGGQGLANAVVTVRSLELDITRQVSTDLQGAYAFHFLLPGRYELTAEAFGYRPAVYPTFRAEAGVSRTVDVTLPSAPPPVTQVDTIRVPETSLNRWRGTGSLISAGDLDAERDLLGGWTSLARFSSVLDPSLGAQGLPGVMTGQVVDGVPFFAARHPYLLGESTGSPAFPASLLSRTSVVANPADAYWLGAAGPVVSAETRTSVEGGAAGVEGSWSGGPLWSSGTLNLRDTPTLTSYRAAGHAGVAVVADTARLFLAGEALRQQSPLPARIAADMSASLEGVDPGLLESLSSPSVETVQRISGLARLDRWGATSRWTVRAAAGHEKHSYDGNGPGRLGYGLGLPEDATDLSAAVTLLSQYDQGLELEFLGGASLSDRTFGEAAGVPPATLVASGVSLGTAEGAVAKVSRVDFFVAPALHLPLGSGRAKLGLAVQASNHTFDQTLSGEGDRFFSDGGALSTGNGSYAGGTSSETSFLTSRIGGFAQYVWEPSPGLRITAGGRIDRETIPTSDVGLNTDWAAASGVRNNEFPSSFTQPAGVLSATWDVHGDGRTIFFGAASVMNGSLDPGLVHEVIAQDGDAVMRRFAGTGIAWPDRSTPSGAASASILTLLGPDTRAPRTSEAGGGIVQDLGSGWSLHVSGSFRRTDFLPRRRDLNLHLYPPFADAYGRDVFGDLRKLGSLVTADPGSNRRFGGFDAVWAVDPDGWSRYRGVSAGLEYASPRSDAFVSYTRSRTTDNWVGAARGLPDATLDPHLPGDAGAAWAEGTSDFDVPDRLVAGARLHLDVGLGAEISATYTYESGRPFTPGYRAGVDANGDGSARNDVAFVPDAATLGGLAGAWPCLADQAGGFAARNSCRGPSRSTLNAAVRLAVASAGRLPVYLTAEGFNLVEDKSGILDSALLLVDPSKALEQSADGAMVTVPVSPNPGFGGVMLPASRGRILRVGLRIGG